MLQWACCATPGIVGHASFAWSQTVINHVKDSPRNGSRVLLVWPEMSIPTSSMTVIASGRTTVASVPALNTSNPSPPHARSMPSAIWLRALLWVQTKMTRCVFVFMAVILEREGQCDVKPGQCPPVGITCG